MRKEHTVYMALGSNLGVRHNYLRQAYSFLSEISEGPVSASPIYESEPVGPENMRGNDYLNAVMRIKTSLTPMMLLRKCKSFERDAGRDQNAPRWSERVIDLDIITFDDLRIEEDPLKIPHPSYHERLFVLLPLRDLESQWHDPVSGKFIEEMITCAPNIRITETNLSWDADP